MHMLRRTNCIHTAFGIVTLKTSEGSNITKISLKCQNIACCVIIVYSNRNGQLIGVQIAVGIYERSTFYLYL
jgi:hypothetical protein